MAGFLVYFEGEVNENSWWVGYGFEANTEVNVDNIFWLAFWPNHLSEDGTISSDGDDWAKSGLWEK